MKKIKDRAVLDRVRRAIENVEHATDVQGIRDLKKLVGSGNDYRIRIGELRIGIVVDGETVEFVRCLPRKDLYRYFP